MYCQYVRRTTSFSGGSPLVHSTIQGEAGTMECGIIESLKYVNIKNSQSRAKGKAGWGMRGVSQGTDIILYRLEESIT